MSELPDFLLARIAEDETRAESAAKEVPQVREDGEVWGVWLGSKWYQSTDYAAHVARHSPARTLAECDAKRRIVELCKYSADPPYSPYDDEPDRSVLYCLALPYADHPDYREEWKP